MTRFSPALAGTPDTDSPDAPAVYDRRVGDRFGFVRRGNALERPAGATEQQALPGRRPQGRRHEQRVPAGSGVGVEQGFNDDPHIGVRGMDFVNHQQVAGQAGRPHVGMTNLQRAHHCLVHGADGDLSGQEPLGRLGGPELYLCVVSGVVFPPDFVTAQVSA